MWEALAVGVGIAIGAGAGALPRARRGVVLVAAALLAGFAISAASGELAESPAFVLFDTAQVLLAGVLTALLVARLSSGRTAR